MSEMPEFENSGGNMFRSLDLFSKNFSMRLDNGEDSLRTIGGACCSALVVILTLFFGVMKMHELISRDDVDVLSTVQEKAFGKFDNFTHDNGLDFAFGFSSFGANPDWELDPSFGELVVEAQSWGVSQNFSSNYDRKEELKTHACSDVELGFKDGQEGAEERRIFKTDEDNRPFLGK